MPINFDAIVIGTGQAGPPMAARLAGTGRKIAVVERHLFGGTCVNTGCMPTKTMVASARALHMARRGADFGFTVNGAVEVDLPRVLARRDEVVRLSNEGIEKRMKDTPNITVFEGHGRFTGPRRVAVNGEVLEAGEIFIIVGGRAVVPNMPRGRRRGSPDQYQPPRPEDPAVAPGDRRRQLHRARVRADLSAPREPGHGGRER